LTPQEPATIVIDQAILDALEQYPVPSIRELARVACIPTTAVHGHLTHSFGFVVKHLRWLPHTLTRAQETERATFSIELLHQPRSSKHQGWQFIITLDES
jgi:hypothetical protein